MPKRLLLPGRHMGEDIPHRPVAGHRPVTAAPRRSSALASVPRPRRPASVRTCNARRRGASARLPEFASEPCRPPMEDVSGSVSNGATLCSPALARVRRAMTEPRLVADLVQAQTLES
jgi:hypothetical protein